MSSRFPCCRGFLTVIVLRFLTEEDRDVVCRLETEDPFFKDDDDMWSCDRIEDFQAAFSGVFVAELLEDSSMGISFW